MAWTFSRTVGWFTSIFPVALDVPGNDEPRLPTAPELARLGEVGRRQLRSIPDNGFGYGPLRYLGSPDIRERLSAHGNGPQS